MFSLKIKLTLTGLGNSFVDYADKQYNIEMESVIPHDYWRKGSQVIKTEFRS